jgi:hypothetical protein
MAWFMKELFSHSERKDEATLVVGMRDASGVGSVVHHVTSIYGKPLCVLFPVAACLGSRALSSPIRSSFPVAKGGAGHV